MPKFKLKKLLVLEANLDDMNPEWFEPLRERLCKAGALDVTLIPAVMKKGRPAVILQVMTDARSRDRLLKIIFEESTTLGVRSCPVERFEVEREVREAASSCGRVKVKIARDAAGRILNVAPEYESCRELSQKKKIPLKEVYAAALASPSASRRGYRGDSGKETTPFRWKR